MPKKFLHFDFDLLHAATNNRYADNVDIRFVNLGVVVLFSKYKLTSSSGKHLESLEHGHVACLIYRILTAAREGDDLSIGFDRW